MAHDLVSDTVKFFIVFFVIIPIIIETDAKKTLPRRNPNIIPFTEQNLLFIKTVHFFHFLCLSTLDAADYP